MGSTAHDASDQTDQLRVVVVAQDAPFNVYVLSRLVGVVRLEKLLTGVAPPNPHHSLAWGLGRLRTAPLATAVKPFRNRVLNQIDASTVRRMARRLPEPGSTIFSAADRVPTADLTGDYAIDLLTRLEPDLMILSGAPLLRSEVFSLPRLGTVNVHWGITPNHRGQQSLFNALRLGDFGAVGATIHYLDEGVDTGPVLAQVRPALDPGDDVASVWAKTAVLVADTLAELVEQLRLGPVPGRRLTGEGLLFRSRDRRVRQHLVHAVRRGLRNRRPPVTEARVDHFW